MIRDISLSDPRRFLVLRIRRLEQLQHLSDGRSQRGVPLLSSSLTEMRSQAVARRIGVKPPGVPTPDLSVERGVYLPRVFPFAVSTVARGIETM